MHLKNFCCYCCCCIIIRKYPQIPLIFFTVFSIIASFVKRLYCTCAHYCMIVFFIFINKMNDSHGLPNIEPLLFSWNKPYSVVIYIYIFKWIVGFHLPIFYQISLHQNSGIILVYDFHLWYNHFQVWGSVLYSVKLIWQFSLFFMLWII